MTRIVVLAAAACAMSAPIAPRAIAQQAPPSSADSYLITNAGDSAIRSGADLAWYVVAQLDRGTVLTMGGEVDNWFRVDYPAGTPAVVKSTDAELHKDRGVVTLTRRSSLLAYNLLNPYMEDCYKRLFAEQPLMPGTELKYIGPMENRRGELVGYKVVAPAGAQGFILPANVRPPTPEEMRAIAGAPDPATEAARPDATTTSTRPVEAAPSAGDGTAPSSTARAPGRQAKGNGAPTNDADVTEVTEVTEATEVTEVAEMTEVTEVTDIVEIVDVETPALVAPRRLDDVDAAYRQVMKQSIDTAEFSQLIAEYAAILAALPAGAETDIERAYIEDQIEFLEIRAQIQEDVRELAALESQAESAQENLDEFVRKIQAARGYLVVGTLSPSIIYDGKRLPLMFRVVSVDAASGGRTLAYVLPNPSLNLVAKLGSLVGVQGEDDPGARRGEVRVIKPSAVDVLTSRPQVSEVGSGAAD